MSRFCRVGALLLSLGSAVTGGAAPLPASLAPYQGRVVYLDFWASWCGPCAQSFPWLNRMRERYGDRLAVVGVNVDTDRAAAEGFLGRHPAKFDIVYDPDGQLASQYRLQGMPSTVILAPDGTVLHQHSGFRESERDRYEAAIARALETASSRPSSEVP